MGKLAETLIRTNEGMGYVPCYKTCLPLSSFLAVCSGMFYNYVIYVLYRITN